MNYILSVIIPCFNSSKTIITYLLTLENNTLSDIEFVIVDDCSNDGSYEKLLQYINTSKLSVSVYSTKVNQGPGVARNVGLDKCHGKYVTFLDSDDFFDPMFFDNLHCLNAEYDMIYFDYWLVNGDAKSKRKIVSDIKSKDYYSINELLVYIRGCPWGKIFLRSIIEENNIRFLPQKRNEDMPFVKTVVSNCHNPYYLKEYLYNYVQNENSLMYDIRLLNPNNALNAVEYINANIDHMFQDELDALYIKHCMYSTSLTNLYLLRKKEWVRFVDSVFDKSLLSNKYYLQAGMGYRVVVRLIKLKAYHLLKILLKFKPT